MKTSNYKTAQFPKMKRLAMYFSVIIVLCFFNLVDIKAQYPNNLTTNTQPATTIVIQEEPEPEPEPDSELREIDRQNMLQKQQQTMQMMRNVSKMIHDTAMAIVRKIG